MSLSKRKTPESKCRHPMINSPKLGVAFVAPKTGDVLKKERVPFETPVIVDPLMQEGEIHFFRPSKCKCQLVTW